MLYSDQLMDKPRTELMSMAAAMQVPGVFSLSKKELVRELVERKMQITRDLTEIPVSETNPSDERLRSKPPAPNATQAEVMELCQPFMDRGLIITFPEADQYHFQFGQKEDSGTLRQPLRVIVRAADILSRTTQQG